MATVEKEVVKRDKAQIPEEYKQLRAAQLNVNETIGALDRVLSEFLLLTECAWIDTADAQTLKHHADDLIGVGNKAHAVLKARGLDNGN